ncbi:D-glycero-beta-D-manno-heptose-7-phosphate kinase [Chitinasiproducens palmae]|uniref:RfaE bifunctional protein, domain I n=1 Tax=Chitinasiproducens palmae TaxID=1770053 RepID=A0A1H2PV21_9BURK|nr:D-glycero-beta-D-manno-heptose-7-phosphate kinase [Chitinasiproducens palmae]SDV51088.1 rfaE bifunctional protein, domain I [Chitinasiproducens palmae]
MSTLDHPMPPPADTVARADLARARVLVVGDVMLDRYWFGDVERISPEAPVPVARVVRSEARLGGAANVARNIVALGGRASLLGAVGDDEPAACLLALLKEGRVDAHLQRDASLETTVKLRVLARQQQLLRVDFESRPQGDVLQACLRAYRDLLGSHDVVLLSDYAKGVLTHAETLIEQARAAGVPVLVDPKGEDWARYRGATMLTPNRAELQQVIGRWQSEAELIERVGALRASLELDAILLTRSEEGMTLFDAAGSHSAPAEAREVFDVSGAGDTVIATVATLLAAGLPRLDSVYHANRAAGIVVAKLGTATVDFDELFGAWTPAR